MSNIEYCTTCSYWWGWQICIEINIGYLKFTNAIRMRMIDCCNGGMARWTLLTYPIHSKRLGVLDPVYSVYNPHPGDRRESGGGVLCLVLQGNGSLPRVQMGPGPRRDWPSGGEGTIQGLGGNDSNDSGGALWHGIQYSNYIITYNTAITLYCTVQLLHYILQYSNYIILYNTVMHMQIRIT